MEILGLILLVLVGGVTLHALFVTLNLLLPAPIQTARLRLESNLWRAFLLGLVNTLFFGAIIALCLWLSQMVGQALAALFIFIGGMIALALLAFILVGLTGFTTLLAMRLGEARTPLAGHLRGCLLLILVCLTPFIGWYVLTPLVLITALGAVILSLFQPKPKPVPRFEVPEEQAA